MKVLVADDDVIYRRVLESTLTGWGYEVVAAPEGDAALKILLSDEAPKLGVLDWMMPGRDGVQVCQELRRMKSEPYTYIILLTSKTYKGDLVAGLQAGADDYLIKPFDPFELQARLFAGRRILDLQDQLVAAREAMRHQATRDHLTGAWNHRAILEILEKELERSRRENRPLTIVMTDLDHFKKINDTYGHLGGDAVLRETGRRLLNAMRPYDMVGRFGGEEFLIVLPGCGPENAVNLAERIKHRACDEPVLHGDQKINVTASMGLTVYEGVNVSVHAILQTADAALYRAKKNGRNRIETGQDFS